MRPRTLAATLLAVCVALSAIAAPKHENDTPRWKPAEVLVKYKKGAAPVAGQMGVMRVQKLFAQTPRQGRVRAMAEASGLDRMYRLELRDNDVEAAVAKLRQDPNVESAEPNWIIRFAAVPNDPSYQWQWGLQKIGAPAAWDVQTSGSGVVVGVVDTGIDLTHPDLAANLWTNPGEIDGNGIDDDGNGYIDDIHGWDFIDNDADPSDDTWGHGTRVAGIIAAVGNNATGVSGVCWSAKIASLRIGSQTGTVDAAIQAIAYANAMGFRVTNNSWGWHEGGQSFLLDDVVEAAEAAGNLFIASAGNESKDNDQLPTYPAHYTNSNVISVTATTSSDTRAYYANYGATSVDLGAPGEFIETTAKGGGYSSANGTSFATPFVSGAAALLWTTNPALTHQQVRDKIVFSSEPLPSLHGKTVSGGRLSLSNMFDSETVAPAAITDLTVIDTTFRSVVLRLTATGDDGTTGSATRYDVRASQSPITAANFDQATPLSGEPIPAGPGTLETFKVTGLEPSTTYYLAARALDNAGNASLSNVVTFTTTRAAVLLDDNVEGGPRSWTVDGSDGVGGPSLWHIQNIYGASNAWRYGNAAGYDTGARNWGTLTSRELDLTQASDTRLRFTQDVWTERNFQRDLAKVEVSVDGGPWTTLMAKQFTLYQAMPETIDLSAYDGHHIRIRFSIDTDDAIDNDNPGWTIDDIVVDATSSNAPPVASINGPYLPMEDAPEALSSAGSSDPEGATLEYKWSFGDGTSTYTTATSVSHTWTLPGVYTVTLVAFDGVNSSDPVSTTVSPSAVNDRPVANISLSFAPPPYNEETPYYVVGFGSTDEEGSPLQCRWDYGDGTTLNVPCVGTTYPHSWNTPGTHTITLIVNDGELDSLPATQSITILEASNDAPVARPGGPYNAQPNQSVTLDGTASSDEETTIASYLWTFADGTTSTASQPVKTFPTAGVQNVTLVVTDQTGRQSATATTQVRVCGATTANLFPNPVYTCPGGTAKVGVNVSNALLPITLTWSDGYTQQVTSLFNGYYAERIVTPTAQTIYALASVTDSLGCAGTVGAATTTVGFASAVVPTATARICPGQSVTIYPTLQGSGPFTITWNDGFTETVTQAPDSSRVVTPSATSTYSITSMTCASCPQGTTAVVSGVYTVEVMEPLSATLTGGGTSCNGGSVPGTVTITGGAPPFTIRWSDGWQFTTSQRTYTKFFNPATTTTYTAMVDSGSCSVAAAGSITVTPWTGTRPSVTGLSNDHPQLCEGQTSTVTATLAGDGLPFTVTWNDGLVQIAESLSISRVVSPSATTVYSITSIVNAAGCSGTVSGNTTVFKRATPTATVSGGGAFCAGGSVPVSATLTGTAPFNITWSDGFTQIISSGTTASRSVSPSTETVYTITSLQDAWCSGTTSGSATATPRALPTATVSGSATICPGQSQTITAALTGTAPFNITWSDGVTQTISTGTSASRSVTPSANTTYTITSLSDAYCNGTSSGSAAVSLRAVPTAMVSGGGSFCEGTSTTVNAALTGTAPFNLTWSDGFTQTVSSGSTATRQVNPAAATTYTITAISDAYCTGTASGSATATPIAATTAVVSGGGSFCEGSQATISAALSGPAPFNITWSDGFTQTVTSGSTATRQVSPASTTIYTITSITGAGCAGTASGEATATPRPSPTATVSGGGPFCEGTSTTIDAALTGTAPFNLTWSDGFTQTVSSGSTATRQVNPASATTYTITAVSDAYCTGTASGSATATPIAATTAAVSGGGSFCNGSQATISAALSGPAPFSITWSDGFTQTISSGTTATRQVSPASTTTYTITSITGAGCAGTASGEATATPRPSPTATVSGGGSFCEGTSTTINAALTGTAPFNITWSDGFAQTVSSGSTATRQVNPASATTYTITAVSDAYCSGTSSGSATATPIAATTAVVSGGGSFCNGSQVTITAALSGAAPFSITWSDGFTQTIPSGTTATRQVSPASPTTYTITSITGAGCAGTSSGSATATPMAIPTAVVSGGGSFCNGSQATINAALSGAAPFSITWSDGFTQTIPSGTTATRQVSPASPTTYTITSITGAGCAGTSSGSATATPMAIPTAVVSGGGTYCPGAPVTITATLTGAAPFAITWSDGFTQTIPSGTTATRQVSPASTTTYSITSFTGAGCAGNASGSATVTPRPQPAAVVSGGGTFCEGTNATINAALTGTAPFNITWSDGVVQTIPSGSTATRQVSPAAATTYTITAISDAYCTGTSSGSATATPILKPVITAQPQNTTIQRNKTATLTVTVSGTNNNYQWYRGTSGNTSTPVGTNSPSFTTPKLTATTSYWVKVWKTGCTAPASATNSQTATVTVQ